MNTTTLFNEYGMSLDNTALVREIYQHIQRAYSFEIDLEFTLDIKQFQVFQNNQINDYGPVFRFDNNGYSLYLNFIEILYWGAGKKYSTPMSIEYQVWGFVELQKKFGHSLIESETILHKIHDFFNPIDIDFKEDIEFSRKFNVVSNNTTQAKLEMTENFRKCFKMVNLKEFIVEINQNKLIIGDKKIISLERTMEFVKFLHAISSGSL